MGEFHHILNRQHERVELRVGDHQGRSDLQNHEVVSADLRQESEIAKQTHHHDLAKHGWMNRPESLKRKPQAKLPGNLEFNAHQQSRSAHFLHHLEVAQRFGQPRLQVVARFDRTRPQFFVLQNLQSRERGPHGEGCSR